MSDPAASSSPIEKSTTADLAFLKRMARAGQGEPAPALVLMAVFGLAYGLLFLAIYAQIAMTGGALTDVSRGPVAALNNYGIPAAHLSFLGALIWTGWRSIGPRRRPLNRGALAAWSGAFIGLLVTVAVVGIFSRDVPASASPHSAHLLQPILLVLWGVAWWTTAIVSRRLWLCAVATGSWALAVAATVAGPFEMLALNATCLLGLAFLPAVILMRHRPA